MGIDITTLALVKKYINDSLLGSGAIQGKDGQSAYEIAVKNGFKGTEIEWLNSLKSAFSLDNITFEIRDGNLYAIYND